MLAKLNQRSPVTWGLMLVVAAIAVIANASGDHVGLGDYRAELVDGKTIELPVAIDWGDYTDCVLAPGVDRDDPPGCVQDHLVSPVVPTTVGSGALTPMQLEDASTSDRWTIRLLVAALSLSIIGAALALARVLQTTVVFAAGTASWLRVCAGFVAFGGLVVPWFAGRFEDGLIADNATAAKGVMVSRVDPGLNLIPLLVVIALLALAEVWCRGVRLREDAEATI